MYREGDDQTDVDATEHPGDAEAERIRLRCRVCDIDVSSEEHVFVVGEDTVGIYVNQHGFAHEIVTARVAWNVIATGAPTTEFTWFAGYAWRHLLCANCGHHLGWSYETTADTRPSAFVGLRTAEIRRA